MFKIRLQKMYLHYQFLISQLTYHHDVSISNGENGIAMKKKSSILGHSSPYIWYFVGHNNQHSSFSHLMIQTADNEVCVQDSRMAGKM